MPDEARDNCRSRPHRPEEDVALRYAQGDLTCLGDYAPSQTYAGPYATRLGSVAVPEPSYSAAFLDARPQASE